MPRQVWTKSLFLLSWSVLVNIPFTPLTTSDQPAWLSLVVILPVYQCQEHVGDSKIDDQRLKSLKGRKIHEIFLIRRINKMSQNKTDNFN